MKLRYKIALPLCAVLGALIVLHLLRYEHTSRGSTTSAIGSLLFIHRVEKEYRQRYPDAGFACSLAALGDSAATPSAETAQLIPPDLASGERAGYVFTFTGCDKSINHGRWTVTGYRLTAVPAFRRSYMYGLCMDQTGAIFIDRKGGTNCTELLQ